MDSTSWPADPSQVPPDVGLDPSAAERASLVTPSVPQHPSHTSVGASLPGALTKEPRGWGEEGGSGCRGKGCGLREGPSSCKGGMGGTLQRAVGAKSTSGGSRLSEVCFS